MKDGHRVLQMTSALFYGPSTALIQDPRLVGLPEILTVAHMPQSYLT